MDQAHSVSKDGGASGSGSDSPTKDKLFDPSIDMLVNDFDDERTLEEEEALEAGEANDPSIELSNLEKEGNMPLDELLTLYGYSNAMDKESSSESEGDEEIPNQEEQICEPILEKDRSPTPPRHSKLSILYEPMADDIDDARNVRSHSRLSEDEDEYGSGEDDDYRKIRKTIMVGGDYQAQIPDGLSCYGNKPPYEDNDQLLWTPPETYSLKVEEYLKRAHEICKPTIPKGSELRDDEEALYLLQQCDYNIDEALKRLENRPPPPTDLTANNINEIILSEEECRSFEAGVRACIKDIHIIQQNKVRHSQRIREKPLEVWIIILIGGSISSARTCMAGLGEVCTHIATTLFFLYARPTTVDDNQVCTSQLSTWPVPPMKNVDMVRIHDVDWDRKTKPVAILPELLNEEKLCDLLQKLQTAGVSSVICRLIEPFASELVTDEHE